jgi:3-oxoacyl-ACP reductase-like protein
MEEQLPFHPAPLLKFRNTNLKNITFKEKIVVITGGAPGIGKATAVAFAEHGARVAVPDVNERLEAGGCE